MKKIITVLTMIVLVAVAASGKKALARQYISSLKENYPGTEADIWEMINHRINSWK